MAHVRGGEKIDALSLLDALPHHTGGPELGADRDPSARMEITGYLRHRFPEAPRCVEGPARRRRQERRRKWQEQRRSTRRAHASWRTPMDESHGHAVVAAAVIRYRPW